MIEHADISHLSGFHTPAKARYFIEYTGSNLDELKSATQFASENTLPILTISGGKNLLLAFDEYPGLVIHNNSRGYELMNNEQWIMNNEGIVSVIPAKDAVREVESRWKQTIPSKGTSWGVDLDPGSRTANASLARDDEAAKNQWNKITVFIASGHPIWELAESLEKEHAITLWHRFLGLPGSIGGAVFGNAGCFGLEVGPYVERVYILDMKTGLELEKSGVELDFKYRWSDCKNHPEWFLLSIVCDLSELREKYAAPEEEPLTWRERVQPEGYSCGSFFKNPSREQSAGLLIEQAGLKGYHHRGAYFSEKHANFLMSDGTATWQDLTELVQLAQSKVREKSGFLLEPEVRIIQ